MGGATGIGAWRLSKGEVGEGPARRGQVLIHGLSDAQMLAQYEYTVIILLDTI